MKLSKLIKNGGAIIEEGNLKLIKKIKILEVDIDIDGDLYCRNNNLTLLTINHPIGGDLYCYNNELTSLIINHPIGGDLDCSYNNLTSLTINHPIGGDLYCSYNELTSLIINHPIGGRLNCSYNNLTSLTINHPIGGGLNCRNNKLTSTPEYNKLRNGDIGKNWIYVDNMLFIFNSIKKLNKYTIYKSIFNNKNIKYLIADGTYYSHCATLAQGILDIEFKKNGGDVSRYEGLTLDDKLTYNEAIIMYRSITRACSGGTNYFLDTHNFDTKKKYSIREIIELTKGQYEHKRLTKFFKMEDN